MSESVLIINAFYLLIVVPSQPNSAPNSIAFLLFVKNLLTVFFSTVLHRAKDVISDTDIILWHLVKVFLRIAKWLARPCIYTVQHVLLFVREV